MSSIGAALGAAFVSSARAEASRINGARSRGPKTPEGKARSSQNALKHGLRAQKFALVGDEDPRAFAALEAALIEELAPVGALQRLLAGRSAAAAWRIERAERIEGELFEIQGDAPVRGWGRLGLALVRDGNGARAFDTLLRYRGSAMAELWRALRTLKALQAEAAQRREAAPELPAPARHEPPIAPEACRNSGEAHGRIGPAPAADEAAVSGQPDPGVDPCRNPPAHRAHPIEPEGRRNPRENGPLPPADLPGATPMRPARMT